MSASEPLASPTAKIEAAEARALAEAAVATARQDAILDRATGGAPSASTLLLADRAVGDTAPRTGAAGPGDRVGADGSPFAREVETVRRLEAPAPERAVDRRL